MPAESSSHFLEFFQQKLVDSLIKEYIKNLRICILTLNIIQTVLTSSSTNWSQCSLLPSAILESQVLSVQSLIKFLPQAKVSSLLGACCFFQGKLSSRTSHQLLFPSTVPCSNILEEESSSSVHASTFPAQKIRHVPRIGALPGLGAGAGEQISWKWKR
jgi:hypothetical protein